MHPFQSLLLALVVAIVAFAAWMAIRGSIEDRRERRGGQTRVDSQVGAFTDSASCDHRWVEWDSGTCTPSYSSYGGPDPQETWTVEQCRYCGARQFSCTGTCDCHAECAAAHEQRADA